MKVLDVEMMRVELARVRDWMMPGGTPWAVAAGSAVFLYTGKRSPADLDVLVRPEDLGSVAQIIGDRPETEATSWGEVTRIQIGRAEVAGSIVVKSGSNRYPYELDPDMIARLRWVTYHGIRVPVLSPEDLVALKAVLQRGPEQGKYDLEDIEALSISTALDPVYLRLRLERMGGLERAMSVLERWNLMPRT